MNISINFFDTPKEVIVLTTCLGLAFFLLVTFAFLKEGEAIEEFAQTYNIERRLAQSEYYAYRRGERINVYN